MSKKKKIQVKKRDLEKYPALNPRLNAKTRGDVLDMDYVKKLNDAELQYLNQFMAEYVSGAFKKDETGNYSVDNFHKTPEERRECYTRNNTRNRCALTISNATGKTHRGVSNSYMDSFLEGEESNEELNQLSDLLIDEYDGDYDMLEEDILREMLDDYRRCINPKNNSDKKLAESNYGKMLLLKFKNSKLIEES